MTPIYVKNLAFGIGQPKICIPVMGSDLTEILQQVTVIRQYPVDLLEWRVDWFTQTDNHQQVLNALKALRQAAGELPVLFTFRTRSEGGKKELTGNDYESLLTTAICSGLIDMVDIQLFSGEDMVTRLTTLSREHKVVSVISNHDFEKTPSETEIVQRMHSMRRLGGDIPKIAVMPQSRQDVLTLLSATEILSSQLDCPIITISMGKLGTISRICGEVFGSVLTFGAAEQSSAPGQIPADRLDNMLKELHQTLNSAPSVS